MVVFFVQLHFTTRVRYGFLSVQLNYTIRHFKCYQHEGIKRMQGSLMEPAEIMDMLDNIKFDDGATAGQYNEVKSELIPLIESNNVVLEVNSSNYQDTDEETLAKIIMWLLGQNKISNK